MVINFPLFVIILVNVCISCIQCSRINCVPQKPKNPNDKCTNVYKTVDLINTFLSIKTYGGVLIINQRVVPINEELLCTCANICFMTADCTYFEVNNNSKNCSLYKLQRNSILNDSIDKGSYQSKNNNDYKSGLRR